MGRILFPEPVKLFCGIIASGEDVIAPALARLMAAWGPTDEASARIPFTFTEYYRGEMGENLLRMWVSFERLVEPGALAAAKRYTNEVEAESAVAGQRRINLDPGYLSSAKVVLASTKDYSHRVYLSDGIYAEVTLIYRHEAFEALPWTYPDYRSAAATTFFTAARDRYRLQLKNGPARP